MRYDIHFEIDEGLAEKTELTCRNREEADLWAAAERRRRNALSYLILQKGADRAGEQRMARSA